MDDLITIILQVILTNALPLIYGKETIFAKQIWILASIYIISVIILKFLEAVYDIVKIILKLLKVK